jgi:hypothetical protein
LAEAVLEWTLPRLPFKPEAAFIPLWTEEAGRALDEARELPGLAGRLPEADCPGL